VIGWKPEGEVALEALQVVAGGTVAAWPSGRTRYYADPSPRARERLPVKVVRRASSGIVGQVVRGQLVEVAAAHGGELAGVQTLTGYTPSGTPLRTFALCSPAVHLLSRAASRFVASVRLG
jgi:hypothetical protein